MESPVRKLLKRNDYNRHKLLRKIKRRRKAAAEQQAHAAEKALKKKLRVTPPKYEGGKDANELRRMLTAQELSQINEAVQFVKLYYNSEGFNSRFKNVSKWTHDPNKPNQTPEFRYIQHSNGYKPKYNGDYMHDVEEDLKVSMPTWITAKYKKTPLKFKNTYGVDNSYKNASYNTKTHDVQYGFSLNDLDYYNLGNTYNVMAHELGHAIDNSINLNLTTKRMLTDRSIMDTERSRNGINVYKGKPVTPIVYSDMIPILRHSQALKYSNLNKYRNNIDLNNFGNLDLDHDELPSESYADLIALRAALLKSKIYDSLKVNNKATLTTLDRARKAGLGSMRLFNNFSDKDIIWMLNYVAQNDSNNDFKINNNLYRADKGKNYMIRRPAFIG